MAQVPKLSVIMTVYNGEAFLQETLDAVWAQTYRDFELVVVNNGCTDGTQDILDAVDDERLRVIQAPQHGSFGDGIRMAYNHTKGRYLAVQDGDDIPLPDRFAKQVAALDADLSLGLVSSKRTVLSRNDMLLRFATSTRSARSVIRSVSSTSQIPAGLISPVPRRAKATRVS